MKDSSNGLSYVISVSLGTDCIRHIRLSGDDTLGDLSDYILQAFEFEDHHLHAFFMDNQAWSDKDSYYSQTGDETGRTTNDCQLHQLHLENGRKFLYLFDFGDAWQFQCEVLEVLEETTPEPLLIYEKGNAPEQYRNYDAAADFIEELLELPVPVPDPLYEAAFTFRSDKIWKVLNYGQLFAVQRQNQTVYCNIADHALYVYPDEKALNSFQKLLDPAVNMDAVIAQNCLICGFHNKNDIPEAVIKSVHNYTSQQKIRLRGTQSFPIFFRDQPDCTPWVITCQEDYALLQDALLACHDIFVQLKQKTPQKLGFCSEEKEIPLLTQEENGFIWGMCTLPEEKPESFPAPEPAPDTVTELKKLPRSEEWECELVYYPSPAQDKPEEAPYYPCFLLAADVQAQHFLSLKLFQKYHQQADALLANFTDELLTYGKIPGKISVRDKRTAALLQSLCDICEIELVHVNSFTLLDAIKQELIQDDNFNTDMQMLDILNEISSRSVEELRSMPEDVQKDIIQLAENDFFPSEIVERLKQAWHF